MLSIYRDLLMNIVIVKGLVVAVVPFFVAVIIRFGRKRTSCIFSDCC